MRNRNTMDMREYLWDNLYYGLVAMVFYRNMFFRICSGLTGLQSRLLLWALAAVCIFLGVLITRKRRRNYVSIIANVLLPFELYGILTYRESMGSGFLWICGISLTLSVLYFALVMTASGCDRRKRYPFMRCLAHGLLGARTILVCSFAVCWLPVLAGILLGNPLISANVPPAASDPGIRFSIRDNMEVVQNLREDRWQGLSVPERLDTLQVVANLECSRLGLPEGLDVGSGILPEGVMACYEDATRQILISLPWLEKDDPREMLDSVCHEVYHGYQHRLCDAWASVDESYRSLQCFAHAEEYSREFADYIDGSENPRGYYTMTCETDARQYAAAAVEEYYACIEQQTLEKEGNHEDLAG